VIVELLVVAALLALTVSRASLEVFQELFPATVFLRERWARTSGLPPRSSSKI
jgi:hypothetical protein